MGNETLGRWGSLFGARTSFDQELARAKDLGAEWIFDDNEPRSAHVVVNSMPGWFAPLWGADDSHLYLRRPEGVWRCPLPSRLADDQSVSIWMREGAEEGGASSPVVGGLIAGAGLRSAKGWWAGTRDGVRREAWQIDDERHPSNFGLSVDADELGKPLSRHSTEPDGTLLAWGGAAFDGPPIFSMADDFLIATDSSRSIRVAFELPQSSQARRALEQGRLRLCFGDRWLSEFQVDVRL